MMKDYFEAASEYIRVVPPEHGHGMYIVKYRRNGDAAFSFASHVRWNSTVQRRFVRELALNICETPGVTWKTNALEKAMAALTAEWWGDGGESG